MYSNYATVNLEKLATKNLIISCKKSKPNLKGLQLANQTKIHFLLIEINLMCLLLKLLFLWIVLPRIKDYYPKIKQKNMKNKLFYNKKKKKYFKKKTILSHFFLIICVLGNFLIYFFLKKKKQIICVLTIKLD